MGTSQEAFNEVRNILKKLDRSIDAARSRRLSTTNRDGSTPTDGTNDGSRPIGRARPIHRSMENNASNTFGGSDDIIGGNSGGNSGGGSGGAPRSGNF